ncbi:MAG TPA: organic hydroperoxide resistance protein [Alphaproteobacteria bacterium]|nr:organic hydroperoxide resistance protein [Alphaproteobacteria bacterium]
MTPHLEKVLYTAKVHTSGGRDGTSRSADGRLDVKLSSPGSSGSGINPEQLFAAAWSACFIDALKAEAAKRKIVLSDDTSIDAEVDRGTVRDDYFLRVRLTVRLTGVERFMARALVDVAHQACPYSKATRGNIDVTINVM